MIGSECTGRYSDNSEVEVIMFCFMPSRVCERNSVIIVLDTPENLNSKLCLPSFFGPMTQIKLASSFDLKDSVITVLGVISKSVPNASAEVFEMYSGNPFIGVVK